ncbi:ADP-ribosylglycohydrolase family protein [Microbacterium esteraromaticum]|uniref:ADP-ribosylglycohydrolase family protein n=1 Tax=Microbacterium esteraromaticum TaxID=57043 RepID=UPI001C9813AB|nr:ADP-ribosylglycohydrolase family protein [Microbacterium esteraromaticum]MBY6059851.1 ADP-ribosylglycohydrolase family protein [Microbacterium esteraromaticum]
MSPTSIQLDRAIGTVVASAAGDALGSQYEFGPQHPDTMVPQFGEGVFGHASGEWTDDTSMAIPLLDALAAGNDLGDSATQSEIVARWIDWSLTSKDVGLQTRAVFAGIRGEATADAALRASRTHHEQHGRSAGNGSLMRTGPVALGYLERPPVELVDAASAIARLTHWEDDNADACALWCLAIRHAILTGELDVRAQVELLPAARRGRWAALVDEALEPSAHPRDFTTQNGWVVRAFQSALAAVAGASSLTDAVHRAIRGGGDTDTVAAIAGALAGAVWGGSAVPLAWQGRLHGWPGYSVNDLTRQGVLAARGGESDATLPGFDPQAFLREAAGRVVMNHDAEQSTPMP